MTGSLWAAVLLMAGLSAAAASIVSLMRSDRRTNGPAFRALCSGLGLGPGDRRQLRRLARLARLRSPATLLVSRGCFDEAVSRGRARGAEGTGRLGLIRERVFGAS